MKFTSVLGHVMGIDFPEECKNWRDYPLEDLFTVRVERKVTFDNKEVALNIEKQASLDIDELYLWLDCDREGEGIAFEVIELVQKKA